MEKLLQEKLLPVAARLGNNKALNYNDIKQPLELSISSRGFVVL